MAHEAPFTSEQMAAPRREGAMPRSHAGWGWSQLDADVPTDPLVLSIPPC